MERLGEADADVAVQRVRQHGVPGCEPMSALDDALGELRRPNMPGTTDRPNWSLPLPLLVDDLPGHPLLQAVAGAGIALHDVQTAKSSLEDIFVGLVHADRDEAAAV